MAKITDDERTRRSDSVCRMMQECPGLTAADIGRRLGDVPARRVRDMIQWARDAGHPITIGAEGRGYYYVGADDVSDKQRAELVRHHRLRSQSYLIAHARLMKQTCHMSATEIAQLQLCTILVDRVEGESEDDRPVSLKDLARLPVERRAGVFALMCSFLDTLQKDPVAWEAERAVLASKYGPTFLTAGQAAALREAKRLLREVDV